MSSKETLPHPTGNFPSIEAEVRSRLEFMDKDNLLLIRIRSRLKELGLKGKRNLPFNLLSLCYGIHFYNHLCRNQLYHQADTPPVYFIRSKTVKYSVYTNHGSIFINLDSPQSEEQLFLPPMQTTEVYENSSIYAPSFIAQILTGLEEASHLHLEILHRLHQPNHCQHSNHAYPQRLWQYSDDDPIAYRAKLWHEFAVLPVQKAYLNYYVVNEYPNTVTEFNCFYDSVKALRQRWIKRKRKNH